MAYIVRLSGRCVVGTRWNSLPRDEFSSRLSAASQLGRFLEVEVRECVRWSRYPINPGLLLTPLPGERARARSLA